MQVSRFFSTYDSSLKVLYKMYSVFTHQLWHHEQLQSFKRALIQLRVFADGFTARGVKL
jgi:hypothetical protein